MYISHHIANLGLERGSLTLYPQDAEINLPQVTVKMEEKLGLFFLLELDPEEALNLLEAIQNPGRSKGSLPCLC